MTRARVRGQWLGTADSITIDAELDMQLEIALEKNDETFAALYGLKLPPPPPDDDGGHDDARQLDSRHVRLVQCSQVHRDRREPKVHRDYTRSTG